MFRWHDAARFFVGETAIKRAKCTATSDFRVIPAQLPERALRGLAEAVQAHQSFCVAPPSFTESIRATPPDFLTFTGGTSGPPKVIRRSQTSWIASFEENQNLFGLTRDDTLATLGDLVHSLSLYAVLEAMHIGMDAHLLTGLRPRAQREALVRHAATILYATPAQLMALTAGAQDQTLPDLRLILSGGGRLTADLRGMCQRVCPNADIRQFYGSAETSFVTISDANTPSGSVGRAYPGVTLAVHNGEVWVRSPYLFDGYAAGSSPDSRWQDAALTIGEMGRLDPKGYLWLDGRRGRMVTISDQNVFPEQIEDAVSQAFPGLICVILPIPDKTRGHRLTAILQAPDDTDLPERVTHFLQDRFKNLIAPQRVLVHPDIPQLPSGKPDLPALAAWVEDRR
ncbi:AMP-binding protein [Sulfitobacter aestuariivivens]|nr:AMP-binding protein [Sulfitobacter aestuariivivens]